MQHKQHLVETFSTRANTKILLTELLQQSEESRARTCDVQPRPQHCAQHRDGVMCGHSQDWAAQHNIGTLMYLTVSICLVNCRACTPADSVLNGLLLPMPLPLPPLL